MYYTKTEYEEFNNECLALIEKLKSEYYESLFSVNTIREDQDINNKANNTINNDYAPTTYSFLEFYFKKHPFGENDHIIDFGCGKGRVMFMAAYYGCRNITGIEYNTRIFEIAKNNIQKFKVNSNSCFEIINNDAKNALIPNTANIFFFFNPFHLKVYIYVFNRIMESIKDNPRKVSLLLYRPQLSTLDYIERLHIFRRKEYFCINGNNEKTLYALYTN